MPYRVTDKYDNIVAAGPAVAIDHGVLKVLDDVGGVDLFLAPGFWASAFWEEPEQ